MSDPLPAEITVTELSDGLRYRLPARQLGPLRFVGLGLIAFGLFFAGFAVFWMGSAIGIGGGKGFEWFGLFFGLFGVPFVVVGLGLAGVGLFILAGHSEIELRRGTLRAIERCGIVRWSWKRSAAGLRRIAVVAAPVTQNGQAVTSGPLADLAALRAEWNAADGPVVKPLWLAFAYPRALLLPLANALAEDCPAAEDVGVIVPAAKPIVEVEERPVGVPAFEELAEQPANSPIVVEETADSLTLRVPPLGVLKGAGGCLTLFGLLWTAMIGFGTVMILLSGQPPRDEAGNAMPLWGQVLFLSVFWAVGLGMLLAGVNMGRKQAVLAVVGDELLVLITGPLGSKRRRWPRREVGEVRIGPSGMEVNDEPVMELQIQPLPGAGKKFGLLGGRDVAELRWLATKLKKALGVQPTEQPREFIERMQQPVESAVEIEPGADGGVTLKVPPAGAWRVARPQVLGGLFLCAFMTVVDGIMFSAMKAERDGAGLLIAGGVSLFFWFFGIAALVSAVFIGRRSAVLAVVGDELHILETGLFGSGRRHWRRADLVDVRTGPGTAVGTTEPMTELQIHPRDGKPFGLLGGREDTELQWLATVLRRALRLPVEQ